jgi:hypothetical protein
MRKLNLVLFVALVTSAGFVLHLSRQLNVERVLNSDLRSQLSARTAAPTLEAAPAAAETAVPSEPVTQPRATKVIAEQAPSPATPLKPLDYWSNRRELLKDPEYRTAFREQQRQQIEFLFRDLPAMLKLTPEQATAVFDLMAEQAARQIELHVQQPAGKQGGRAQARAIEERQKADDAEMRKLLGASNMARMEEYRDTLSSRSELNMVRSELAHGPTALREDQFQPMLDIIIAEEQRMSRELQEAYAADPALGSQPIDTTRTKLAIAANQRIVDSARSVLSQDQLQLLQTIYRRQQRQMETQNNLMRIQAEAMARAAREGGSP